MVKLSGASSIDISEAHRLEDVQAALLLVMPESQPLTNLALLASALFGTPIALVSLLDSHRQWLCGRVGTDTTNVPRAGTFCDITVQHAETLVIEDALADPLYADSPYVLGPPHVRFYAGTPLVAVSGFVIGTFCIASTEPRPFSPAETDQLAMLARIAMTEINLQLRVGRRSDITSLPNRGQLAEDLTDLCQIEPDTTRSLVLIETMHPTEVQRAVRAVGIAPLERALRDAAARLQTLASNGTRLYHVSETRFALLVEGSIVDHVPEAESVVRRMREPFVTMAWSSSFRPALAP